MNTLQQPVIHTDFLKKDNSQPSETPAPANDRDASKIQSVRAPGNRFFAFITELRRRRVCRAAASYAVAMWLVCQVLEIVAPELGLPDWTVRFVILIGLLGLPIALILSWLFEITPNGLVMDDEVEARQSDEPITPASRIDRTVDCALVLAALVVGTQLAIGSLGTATASDVAPLHKIAVAPFRVAGSSQSTAWSEGLVIELQHELAEQSGMTVISPRDPFEVENCLQLTGSVTLSDGQIHVTATIIESDTGIVSWSQRFVRPRTDSLAAPAEFARDIVSALSSRHAP